MKKNRKKLKKQAPFMIFSKVILMILTAIYPFFMTIMTGIGIVSNSASYGRMITGCGVVLLISGAAMTAAAVMCIFRKRMLNILAIVISVSGFTVCMGALYKLVKHAENAGWMGQGAYSLMPVADMYKQRIIPVILPFLLTFIISVVQFFSYNAAEERRKKRQKNKKSKNSPASKIIDP